MVENVLLLVDKAKEKFVKIQVIAVKKQFISSTIRLFFKEHISSVCELIP